MSHTPGPWVYAEDKGPDARPFITTVAHCCEYVIGLPSDHRGGNYRDGDPSGDPEADACLIASAPELAFHLLAAANYIDALGGDSKSYRIVLAKATKR